MVTCSEIKFYPKENTELWPTRRPAKRCIGQRRF